MSSGANPAKSIVSGSLQRAWHVEIKVCISLKTRHLIPQVKSIDLARGATRNRRQPQARSGVPSRREDPRNRRTEHWLFDRQLAIGN
jgi:hypothetical protein